MFHQEQTRTQQLLHINSNQFKCIQIQIYKCTFIASIRLLVLFLFMKPAVFTEFYLIHCLIHTHTHNIPHLYDNHTHQKFSCIPESISVASGPQLCKLRKYFDRQKSWLQQLCTRIDEMISRLQIDIFLNKKQPDNKCSRELEVLI